MFIFKLKSFNSWAKNEKLTDKELKKAVYEISKGLIEASLGGGLYKKRIAKKGFGKRGGYRILLAFKKKSRIVFLFGFGKNERDNIDEDQLKRLRKLAIEYLKLSDEQIRDLINNRILIEVEYKL